MPQDGKRLFKVILPVPLDSEVARTISDYLCSECKSPWYIRLGTREEYCFNPSCKIRDTTHTLPNLPMAEPLNTEMRGMEECFLNSVSKWKKGKLLLFAYEARLKEIQGLWSTGRVRIPEIMHVDEFLIRVSNSRTGTGTPSARDFQSVYRDFASLHEVQRMIEDINLGTRARARTRRNISISRC